MSHDSTAATRKPEHPDVATPDASKPAASKGAPVGDYEPTDAMKDRNRRLGMIFLGIIAFLAALTVITRIILSS